MLNIIHLLKLHPLAFKLLRVAAMFFGLLLAAVLYVALVGVSIDASSLRGKVAAMLAQNLGREVRFDGEMQLEVSARPELKVGGMHIANAAGFAGSEFASLGEVKLALDLWPLLRMRFQIEELSGSEVHLRLQMSRDGSNNNWMFKPAAQQQEEVREPEQAGSMALASVLARLDIKRVSLEKLDVEFIAADAKKHFFELQSLVAQLPAGEPIRLSLHGKVEKTHPYRLDFTGGSITELANPDKPWPLELKLDFMSSRLSINGAVSGSTGTLDFAMGTQNLGEFEQLLQIRLPAVGASNISGTAAYAPGKITLEKLDGHMGKTTLQGALSFDYGGGRPMLKGALTLPQLDMRPFITDKADVDETPPKGFAEVYREIAAATFNLKALNNMDADLTLHVGKWLSLPGEVHDAKLQVKLEQGRLTMPVHANVADVKLSGSASVDASVKPARFKLALGTHDSSLGNLAALLMGIKDVKGRLGRFDLRVAARGDHGSTLMESLDVQLNVLRGDVTYGNGAGERPVQLALDKLLLSLPAGKPLRGELQGSLLDKRFSATLRGGALSSFTQEAPVPFDFELQAGSATAQIHALMQTSEQNSKSEASFELDAPHSGEIASWLGLKPGADAPISLRGKFYADSASWHLSGFSLKLGRSDLSAEMSLTSSWRNRLIMLNINSGLLDVEQLQALLPEAKENAAAVKPAAENMMDIPILPSGISLADADIAVRIGRIRTASPVAVRDVSFDGQIRDGMMPVSPFSANVAESDFRGAIMLDLRTHQPHSVIWLGADALDAGALLKKLGITGNIEAAVDHLSLQLDLHSSQLGALLAQSELLASMDGGHVILTDANNGGAMRIELDHGELKSAAGAPVNLDLAGSLNHVPVTIGIRTARAADLINPGLSLPFELNASTAGATIKLSGNIERPFTRKGLVLGLDMSGSRFDNLNALTQTSLPPWGPWSASGKFLMSANGYEVSALRLQVGSSELAGYGKLDMKAVPPRLDVALTAPTIQLDDFRMGDWSPEKSRAASAKKSEKKVELRQKANTASQQAQQILSREVLARQNAYLTVQVDQVVSGKDMLGNGKLEARLQDGRAALGPVVVHTPGGSASFLLKYEPGDKDVLVNLRAQAEHFDYGILARRIDHKSEMSGVFSLDIDVNARTQYLSDIFKSGKGYIDFAVWPENLKSGLLDVWAVNVLMALLPAVDSSRESKVNCAIGKFVLLDGKLSDKSILIDTSRMRVSGKGGVDFNAGNILLYVQPRAKTPQFLSLALPIELSGSLDDFSVGVRAADVVESVGQLATSVVWVPLQMLFGKETPADGRDVCAAVASK